LHLPVRSVLFGAMLSLVATPADGPALSPDVLDRVAAAAALEARELRLLAHAVGDHLPIELALQVAELRARRAALAA
jgi:hypothetical protein